MNALKEESVSLWMEVPLPERSPLAADIKADVVVVGSGIAGLSTAYELARAGKSAVVLDHLTRFMAHLGH